MRISDWSSDVCSSDLGVYAARGPDFARIMSQAVAEQTDSMFHLLGQSQIRVDGDVAGADSYFLAVSRNTGDDGVVMCNQLGGRFVDYLERVDGGWKIKKRIVVRDWSISMPVTADWTALAKLRAGLRSNNTAGLRVGATWVRQG